MLSEPAASRSALPERMAPFEGIITLVDGGMSGTATPWVTPFDCRRPLVRQLEAVGQVIDWRRLVPCTDTGCSGTPLFTGTMTPMFAVVPPTRAHRVVELGQATSA